MANSDPKFSLRPESKIPWPLIAVVAAALILAAFIYLLPRQPKAGPVSTAAESPQQPFGQQIQMKDMVVQPSPDGGNIYIQGSALNTGTRTVNEITVVGRFYDKDGRVVHQDTVPMQALPKKTGDTVAISFAESPLKANSDEPFRIAFSGVPQTWNHEMPQLEIAHVSFQGGNPSESAQDKGPLNGQGKQQLPASDVTTGSPAAAGPVGDASTAKPSPSHEKLPTKTRHKKQ